MILDYDGEYHSYDIEYNVIYLFFNGMIFDDLVCFGMIWYWYNEVYSYTVLHCVHCIYTMSIVFDTVFICCVCH